MPIVSFRMVAAIGLAVSASACGTSSFTQSETREPVTVEQFDVWMEELSNWDGGVTTTSSGRPT